MTKKTEEFKINGEDLLKKVKALIAEGNIRRITIRSKEGKNIAEFPLTIGVVGAIIAPVLAAIGTIAALITECTLVVEREDT
jgi:integral membrane sensor domain MASE1